MVELVRENSRNLSKKEKVRQEILTDCFGLKVLPLLRFNSICQVVYEQVMKTFLHEIREKSRKSQGK